MAQIANIPILAVDIDFSSSRFKGLKAYENGIVKEGVDAGGAVMAAMMKTRFSIAKNDILREVEGNYEQLIGLK